MLSSSIQLSCCECYTKSDGANPSRVCSVCRKLSICKYCRNEYIRVSKNYCCSQCQLYLGHYGKPSVCKYCKLDAAFYGDVCLRCKEFKLIYGSPISCAQCKLCSVFDFSNRFNGKLLCWLCSSSCKRTTPKAKYLLLSLNKANEPLKAAVNKTYAKIMFSKKFVPIFGNGSPSSVSTTSSAGSRKRNVEKKIGGETLIEIPNGISNNPTEPLTQKRTAAEAFEENKEDKEMGKNIVAIIDDEKIDEKTMAALLEARRKRVMKLRKEITAKWINKIRAAEESSEEEDSDG